MKKTINVKPVSEIALDFDNGETITLRFDIRALMQLKEMHDLETLTSEPIPEVCAMLVASSAVDQLDLEEARSIVASMDLSTIMAIMSEWNDSLGGDDEATKKVTAAFLNKKMSK